MLLIHHTHMVRLPERAAKKQKSREQKIRDDP